MTVNDAPERRRAQVSRHDRGVRAEVLECLRKSDQSQASVARQYGVPRTTLRAWLEQQQSVGAERELVEFLNSPVGLAFLHRLLTAAFFVFGLAGLGSCRLLHEFLRLSGLAIFVASSKSTCHELQTAMVDHAGQFARDQRAKLTVLMTMDLDGKGRQVVLCADETFPRGQVCLVVIEPRSNFIVLESFAKDRQAATWILAAREALRDLPVQVVQVVADGGKAIAALAKHFEAHLSPDLMHVLQPMVRSIWAAVGKRLKPDKPSAPSPEAVSEVQQQADTLKVALQEINAAYHPLQMNTGQWQSTHQAIERIDTAFETIEAVCNALQLEERARKAVRKSQAYLDAMVRTVGRAERLRKRLLNSVPPLERQAVDVEWRAAYLDKMARSASAAERTTLHQLAAQLRQELGPHHVLSEHAADAVQQGIAIFERSSSCVEGRNGVLALCHHGAHHISTKHLEALTCIHNYFTRRPDGTTAAERFFGHKHDDLFEYMLSHMDYSMSPRNTPSRTLTP